MTALSESQANHRAMINEMGEDIAIRRFTGTGTPRPYTDTTTRARVMGYKPQELIGPVVEGDRKVIALVDTLTSLLPITTNDKAVVGGKQLAIKAVDDNTRRVSGTLVALELQVAG
jgi:hypothetical protein